MKRTSRRASCDLFFYCTFLILSHIHPQAASFLPIGRSPSLNCHLRVQTKERAFRFHQHFMDASNLCRISRHTDIVADAHNQGVGQRVACNKSCGVLQDTDYIICGHPESQRWMSPGQLRRWYGRMMDSGRQQGVVSRATTLWKEHLEAAQTSGDLSGVPLFANNPLMMNIDFFMRDIKFPASGTQSLSYILSLFRSLLIFHFV